MWSSRTLLNRVDLSCRGTLSAGSIGSGMEPNNGEIILNKEPIGNSIY